MHFRTEQAEKKVDSLSKVSSDQTSEQKYLLETIQLYEEKITNLEKRFEDEHAGRKSAEEQMESLKKHLSEEKTSQVGFVNLIIYIYYIYILHVPCLQCFDGA